MVARPVPGVSGNPSYDPSKPRGRGEQAPLTPEYQAIFEANLADQAEGGQGTDATFNCLAPGMPRTMIVYGPMEIVITPDITYILIEYIHDDRRIYTDGRDWPAATRADLRGLFDRPLDRRRTATAATTRSRSRPAASRVRAPTMRAACRCTRTIRPSSRSGSISTRPIRSLLHDEITTIDHALTRPWTVTKNYRRSPSPQPFWREYVCAENNSHVQVGNETYYLSADGLLMPAKKDQAAAGSALFRRDAEVRTRVRDFIWHRGSGRRTPGRPRWPGGESPLAGCLSCIEAQPPVRPRCRMK